MNADDVFRWIVPGLVVVMRLVRMPRSQHTSWSTNWPAMRRHRLDAVALFGCTISMVVALILYVGFPRSIQFAQLGFPLWLRILGVVVALLGVTLLWWADTTLGDNLSVTLQVKENHSLVTTGPYRFIRHPVYAAGMSFFIGTSAASANWVVATLLLGSFTLLYAQRIPQEEKMMLDHFGEEYRQYMQVTGRLIPRIGRQDRASRE
jgi:protein-S-isoprenylcysteine O-methyltransferase Ste14